MHDLNIASVYMLLGLPVFAISILFGIAEWIDSVFSGESRTEEILC